MLDIRLLGFQRCIAVCVLVMASTVATAQTKVPCQCRNPDGTLEELGTVTCVNITGNQYLVRCEMSTNTPYWKRVNNDKGCPLALLNRPGATVLDETAVQGRL